MPLTKNKHAEEYFDLRENLTSITRIITAPTIIHVFALLMTLKT
jgi:hypothetical protein